MSTPLAERIRPQKLSDYKSQLHLVGPEGALTRHIHSGTLPSMIFWGPPGTGKTTLAIVLAAETKRPLHALSAVNAGVKEVRELIDKVRNRGGLFGQNSPILFIDEIHRFNKAQQDSLLEAVEKGWVTLIGATTENPSFEVIAALLSRCQVYVLNPLTAEDMLQLLERAIAEDEELRQRKIKLVETAALFRLSGGDARRLLNSFELVVMQASRDEAIEVTDEQVQQVVQSQPTLYDKNGEQHYDIISAFIKSIRGSDPNAAVYWLARMLEGGEDVKFIARRMIILASEDIGNANPNALVLANSTFEAVSKIGMPEARIILSQCAIYLASSEKSNASYVAIEQAFASVRSQGDLPVPMAIRNAPTKLMKEMGYGQHYQYAHSFEDNFVKMEFLPDRLAGTTFYEPGINAKETQLRHFLKNRWAEKYGY